MSVLSHEEMVNVFKNGGSVIMDGKHIASLAELPSAAELARGDAVKEKAVAANLDAQIAHLIAEKAKLSKPVESKPPVKTEK